MPARPTPVVALISDDDGTARRHGRRPAVVPPVVSQVYVAMAGMLLVEISPVTVPWSGPRDSRWEYREQKQKRKASRNNPARSRLVRLRQSANYPARNG
jgi:hypothetical protein